MPHKPVDGRGASCSIGAGSDTVAGADLRGHLAAQVAAVRGDLPQLGEVEPVHDLRVRARRLRSLLRTHRAYLPTAADDRLVEDLVDGLRWLGRVVGRLRDLDVVTEGLARAKADGALHRAWLADLRAQRAVALVEATVQLDGPLGLTLLRRLDDLLEVSGWSGSPRPTLEDVLPGRRTRVLSLAKAATALPTRTPEEAEAWHDVRKAAKELRYAAEALAASGPGATRWARAGRRLQAVIGRQLDRRGVATWLEAFAVRHDSDRDLAAGSRARATHERRKGSRRHVRARERAVARVRDLA